MVVGWGGGEWSRFSLVHVEYTRYPFSDYSGQRLFHHEVNDFTRAAQLFARFL